MFSVFRRRMVCLAPSLVGAALWLACPTPAAPGQPAMPGPSVQDALTFGDTDSEQAHGLSAEDSRAVTGGLGEPARVLLPRTPQTRVQDLASGRTLKPNAPVQVGPMSTVALYVGN